LVGYPSLSNKNRTAALNNITFGQDVDSIWTYNAERRRWQEIGEWDQFEECLGGRDCGKKEQEIPAIRK
jgi:hypothetical protein